MGRVGECDQTPSVRPPERDTFALAFDEAVAAKGLSLQMMRRQLADRGVHVGTSTLSYWRSGQRQPEGTSLVVVARLEELLDLSPGHLLSRIGAPRRPGPAPRTMRFSDLMGASARERALLQRHGLDDEEDLVPQSMHVVVDVARNHDVERLRHRAIVRSTVDGAQELPLVLRLERPAERVTCFRALAGGSMDGEGIALSEDLHAASFVLDRPLRVGETAIYEYELTLPEAAGFHHYEQFLLRRIDEVLVWVRFHPEAVPPLCVAYQEDEVGNSEATIDLSEATSAHLAARSFGPGALGIRWRW